MSVKRYNIHLMTGGGYSRIQFTEVDDGEYVLATDFDALAAERDALKAHCDAFVAGIAAADDDYDALLAQAERLAGALNAYATHRPYCGIDTPRHVCDCQVTLANEALAAYRQWKEQGK